MTALRPRRAMRHPAPQYAHRSADPSCACAYLWPLLLREIERLRFPASARVFDLGCGSGATSGLLASLGFDVTGVDPSAEGVRLARAAYPACRFETASAYDDLARGFGRFPLVVSLEVVEHLYDPHHFARTLFDLVEPGGTAIVSTPYHGYLKNLVLSAAGRMDRHFTALWRGGHIKFFSPATLSTLLTEAGFQSPRIVRAGRFPPLAKSMMAIALRRED